MYYSRYATQEFVIFFSPVDVFIKRLSLKGDSLNFQLALSSERGLSLSDFVTAWNDDPHLCSQARRISLPPGALPTLTQAS